MPEFITSKIDPNSKFSVDQIVGVNVSGIDNIQGVSVNQWSVRIKMTDGKEYPYSERKSKKDADDDADELLRKLK